MQRSPAPKPCPDGARGCGVSPSRHLAAPSSHSSSTNCCWAFLTVPGLPAPLRAQDQAPPEQVSWPWRVHFSSTSPSSFCGCCQPRSRLLSHFLGHHGAQQDLPPPRGGTAGGGLVFSPSLGGGSSTWCRFQASTQEPAFTFLVKWHQKATADLCCFGNKFVPPPVLRPDNNPWKSLHFWPGC